MKKVKWVNGNKMLFESEYKTFNKAVDLIGHGNVMGNVQTSGYIRGYSETECNGLQSPKGHLQNYDLDWLNKHLPYELKDWIKGQNKTFVGYSFFYWKNGGRIFIGWVVTCQDKLVKKVYAKYNSKTISALDECIKYITN